MSTPQETQGLLPFEPAERCRHPHATVSTRHQVCAEGRACNHDVTCDACGRVVATESWSLLGAAGVMHAKAYPA